MSAMSHIDNVARQSAMAYKAYPIEPIALATQV